MAPPETATHMPWPGYIATVTLPDGRGGGILDLRCRLPETAESFAFRRLAMQVCEVMARRSPRYLRREHMSPEEGEAVLRDCRAEALRRGIPDDDLAAYAQALREAWLAAHSLLELPMGDGTVAQALEEFGRTHGDELEIRRYHRMSLED